MIVSLLGAKLVLLAGNFSYYLQNPKELFWVARSGGVFQGRAGLRHRLRPLVFPAQADPDLEIADIAAPALALGHGFGRIGCFMAGCCYGKECVAALGRRRFTTNTPTI